MKRRSSRGSRRPSPAGRTPTRRCPCRPKPPPPGVYVFDVGRPLPTARVRVGAPGVPRDDPDRPVLAAIAQWLGGSLEPSRADRALRVERGLSWRARALFAPGDLEPGEIAISAPALAGDAS